MAFTEKPKIKDYAKVGIIDYSNWQCANCGTFGTGKAAFRQHQNECLSKGNNERNNLNDEQEKE